MKKVIPFIFSLAFAFFANAQVTITDPTGNKGKVEWPFQVTVGTTTYGTPISGEFKFKNISTDSLTLKSVESGCKCTITDYPKMAIPPGGEGTIKATYDAMHEGEFYKMIFVKTNFDPTHEVVLAMLGTVKKK